MLIQAALGLLSLAWAGPQTFTTSGRLLDADGAAIDGTLSTSFSLLDGGTTVWTETQSVPY